jgi:hypothetical protein
VESEINQIEEVFNIQDSSCKSKEVSTEIRIQATKDSSNKYNELLLGLLDTGATGIFVKRTALNSIHHQIKPTNIRVKGRYAQSHINEIALLTLSSTKVTTKVTTKVKHLCLCVLLTLVASTLVCVCVYCHLLPKFLFCLINEKVLTLN